VNEQVRHRMLTLELLAGADGEYMRMLQENAGLERQFINVLSVLPTEQMDIICDYLMHCESMSDRVLELACIHMRFPE